MRFLGLAFLLTGGQPVLSIRGDSRRDRIPLESVQKLSETSQELMSEGDVDHGFC